VIRATWRGDFEPIVPPAVYQGRRPQDYCPAPTAAVVDRLLWTVRCAGGLVGPAAYTVRLASGIWVWRDLWAQPLGTLGRVLLVVKTIIS
jgi:hypothetical protein